MGDAKIKNVMELAKSLGESPEFADDLAAHLNKRRLIRKLAALRGAKGLTQQEIAEKIEMTQSRVSKLEASEDVSLDLGFIAKYARALNLQVTITLTSEDATAVDQVKHHAFCIKRLTDRLAHLALADEKIAAGVSGFFNEAAFHLLHMLQDSASKLPLRDEEITSGIIVETCGMGDPEELQRNEPHGGRRRRPRLRPTRSASKEPRKFSRQKAKI